MISRVRPSSDAQVCVTTGWTAKELDLEGANLVDNATVRSTLVLPWTCTSNSSISYRNIRAKDSVDLKIGERDLSPSDDRLESAVPASTEPASRRFSRRAA